MSNVHIIKGKVEAQPEYVCDHFLDTYIKIFHSELALQQQEKKESIEAENTKIKKGIVKKTAIKKN